MNTEKYKNRLYGRTRGRSNKKISIENYFNLLEKFKLSRLDKTKKYILDIGTGYGETSVFLSKKYYSLNILSCEKYIDGNLNLLRKINIEKISNINIFSGNVHEILDTNSKYHYFNLVWIFFPDPWPKKKHFKRRLITKQFLEKIYEYINNNGEIWIVTDSVSYAKSILNNIYKTKHLYEWKNQYQTYLGLKDYYELETKFYKKAIISGRNPSLFIIKKI